MRWYHRANERRRSIHDPDVRPRRIAFLKEAIFNLLILQLLFLCLFAYIFGALFDFNNHTHNIKIVFVDYDGGPIGAAFRQAYSKLRNEKFPTLYERSPLEIPASLVYAEVCSTRYWAAVHIQAGASERLAAALAGGTAASTYEPSAVVTTIWNEARYPTVADSAIRSNIQTLSAAASLAYTTSNGTSVLQSTNTSSAAAVAIFANPWTLDMIDIQPTSQGARVIYNTMVIVLILIQEFFYLGTVNGLYARFKLFGTIRARRIILYRTIISGSYTCIGALCVSGMIWAFRLDWNVSGGQYALTWLVLWLFAHLNFMILDIFTVWLPAPYVPMSLITWVIMNIASILLPFELSPAFYRWGYAIPANEVFQVLIDIWSSGCNPRLHIALPVLFAWEIVGVIGSGIGVYRRCHYAVVAQEQEEESFKERVRTAVASEHKREEEEKQIGDKTNVALSQSKDAEEKLEEQELRQVIREENRKQAQMDAHAAGKVAGFLYPLPYSTQRGLTRQNTA